MTGRVNMGVPALDEMLGGGLPAGYSLLVVGPSGSGKTVLATEFLAEGARRGEPGVIAAFEKSPSQLLNNKLAKLVAAGQVGIVNTRALDLTIDETLHDLISLASRLKARRIVIDSLSGFELALSPEFSEDFRGSLYRMVAELTSRGMTVLLTSELEDRYTDLRFSPTGSAFLVDAIIAQRYIELDGQLKRALSVIKVRGSAHSKDIRLFDITDEGLVLGAPLSGYSGIFSGQPRRRDPTRRDASLTATVREDSLAGQRPSRCTARGACTGRRSLESVAGWARWWSPSSCSTCWPRTASCLRGWPSAPRTRSPTSSSCPGARLDGVARADRTCRGCGCACRTR